MSKKNIGKLVKGFYSIDEATQRLINAATFDLYFGPYNEGEHLDEDEFIYPGFTKALKLIEEGLPDINTLYIDTDCEHVQETEPEPYFDKESGEMLEPFWESIVTLKRKEVLSILLGKELHTYL